MFSLIAGFWQWIFAKPNLHVLIIGLDHAGKTTILEKIKGKFGNQHSLPPDRIPPTVGMNLAKIVHKGSKVVFWDLGGQIKMRSMWEKYYEEANAVVFVIDSADINRLEEAKLAFDSACEHDFLARVPVIIFANKQDLPGALQPSDIEASLSQYGGVGKKVFPLSAITNEGLEDAIKNVINEAIVHAKSTV